MRPIADIAALAPGSTLYHSAFGFATVVEVQPSAVKLSWEREGGHLPETVRLENLQRVYSMCATDGFFHRALVRPDALRHALHERPSEALVWLLDDLAQPQRLRDVMDWLVGRDLFTPKTFVRWWGMAEAAVKTDHRLALDGEWLALRNGEGAAAPLTQLEPGAVEAEPELEAIDPSLDTFDDGDLAGPGTSAPWLPRRPTPLAELQPPAITLADVGHAVAEALAHAHGQGELVHPNAYTTLLHPDGRVSFAPPSGRKPRPASTGWTSTAAWAEPPSPGADVKAAAVVLLEAYLGRGLPPMAQPADVMPHARRRLTHAPAASLAPLFAALRVDPDARPTASAWADQFKAVRDTELRRTTAFDARSILHAGCDTHVGRTKMLLTQINQDALWIGTSGVHGLYVLADGISISDAGRGDIASRLAIQAISRLWQAVPHDRVSVRRLLDRALHVANRAICEHSLRAAGGDLTGRMPMGTTITVVASRGNRVHLAWLGDSRAYLVGPWGASQLTADDNVSGERFGAWCEGEARSWNPDGHALVRYLGHFDEHFAPAPFPAHHTSFVLLPGERLVLTSDGITDYIDAHEAEVAARLAELVPEGDAYDAAVSLTRLANQMGGGDNATTIILEVDDSGVEIW